MSKFDQMLRKHGLVVYESPKAHIPVEDLVLAFGAEITNTMIASAREEAATVELNEKLVGINPVFVIKYLGNTHMF